jgi:hypothetical protein
VPCFWYHLAVPGLVLPGGDAVAAYMVRINALTGGLEELVGAPAEAEVELTRG